MPAEVESLAYSREVPWHRLGTRVEGLMTAAEALSAAGLDWHVRKQPIFIREGEDGVSGSYVQVPPSWQAVVRETDGVVLGTVGGTYEPLQNVEAFEFMDGLVDSGEAKYDTAGSLRGGRHVFMALKFPKEILIAGQDAIDLYGVLWNSHDGSKAVHVMATPIRPVCMNTLQLGLRQARRVWVVRHTGSLEGKLAEARRGLELTYQYADEFAEQMDKLAQSSFSDAEMEQLIQRLTNPDQEKLREGLKASWEGGPDRGTHGRANRYDAFNAVTEYIDWLRNPRTATSQMNYTLFAEGLKLRNHTYQLLAEPVAA